MKKIYIFFFIITLAIFFMEANKVNGFEHNNSYYDVLNNNDINKFKTQLNNNMNKKHIGKFYRVGIMGHRRVVELGEIVSIEYRPIVVQNDKYTIGSVSGIKVIESESFEISKSTSTEISVSKGFTQVMNAAINFGDTAAVGTSNESTTSTTMTYKEVYTETSISTKTTEITFDFSKVYPKGSTVTVGQVALVVVFKINASYTQEDKPFKGWTMIKSTLNEDYLAHYYAETFTTFIYQAGFGDTSVGYFPFGKIKLD